MLAIRQVLDGKIYVSEKISAEILQTYSASRSGAEVSPMEQLTDRELEVFQLIGQGKSTREVATKLHLSIKTIEAHRAHIKTKLNITSATELMRFAVHWTEMQKAKI
jgi:DNA-binding NarL/FixJ family response regulator